MKYTRMNKARLVKEHIELIENLELIEARLLICGIKVTEGKLE